MTCNTIGPIYKLTFTCTLCIVLGGCASANSLFLTNKKSLSHSKSVDELLAVPERNIADGGGPRHVGLVDHPASHSATVGKVETPVISRYATSQPSGNGLSSSGLNVDEVLRQIQPLRQQSPEKYAVIEDLLRNSAVGIPDVQSQALALALYLIGEREKSSGQHSDDSNVSAAVRSGNSSPEVLPTNVPQTGQSEANPRLREHPDQPVKSHTVAAPSRSMPPDAPAAVAATTVSRNSAARIEGPNVSAADSRPTRDEKISRRSADASNQPQLAEPASADTGDSKSDRQPTEQRWQATLAETIKLLEVELASDQLSATERTQREILLRCMYAGVAREKDAVRSIDSLDESRQEFWKNFLHAFITEYDPNGMHASSRRAALALRPLRQAAENLADLSPLEVRNLAFCSAVESFGKFVEFSKSEFKAKQEVLLYVELENFVAEKRGTKYETELMGSYEVRNSRGERIAESSLPTDKQDSINRRRDYYIAYRIFMPAEIEAGDYVLQLTIEDAKGKKSNHGSLNFRIRS